MTLWTPNGKRRRSVRPGRSVLPRGCAACQCVWRCVKMEIASLVADQLLAPLVLVRAVAVACAAFALRPSSSSKIERRVAEAEKARSTRRRPRPRTTSRELRLVYTLWKEHHLRREDLGRHECEHCLCHPLIIHRTPSGTPSCTGTCPRRRRRQRGRRRGRPACSGASRCAAFLVSPPPLPARRMHSPWSSCRMRNAPHPVA